MCSECHTTKTHIYIYIFIFIFKYLSYTVLATASTKMKDLGFKDCLSILEDLPPKRMVDFHVQSLVWKQGTSRSVDSSWFIMVHHGSSWFSLIIKRTIWGQRTISNRPTSFEFFRPPKPPVDPPTHLQRIQQESELIEELSVPDTTAGVGKRGNVYRPLLHR